MSDACFGKQVSLGTNNEKPLQSTEFKPNSSSTTLFFQLAHFLSGYAWSHLFWEPVSTRFDGAFEAPAGVTQEELSTFPNPAVLGLNAELAFNY